MLCGSTDGGHWSRDSIHATNRAPILANTPWHGRWREPQLGGPAFAVAHAPSKTHRGSAVFIPIFTRRAGVPILVRAAATPVSLPLAAGNTEASARAGDDPCRERLWRHKPSALPSRMVGDSGGARTQACRVGTLADTQYFRDLEAATRVSLRHARVRAPLQPPRVCNGSRRGLWRASTRHAECVRHQHPAVLHNTPRGRDRITGASIAQTPGRTLAPCRRSALRTGLFHYSCGPCC